MGVLESTAVSVCFLQQYHPFHRVAGVDVCAISVHTDADRLMTHEKGVSHLYLQPSNVPILDRSKPCLLSFSSARDPTIVMGSLTQVILCFWMRANKILLCLWDGQLDYRRHVDAFQ